MKRVVFSIIVLIFMFFCNLAYAEDAIVTEQDNPVNTSISQVSTDSVIDLQEEYSISKLQEIAVSNSRQALVDDVDIKKKEFTVRTITSDVAAMSDSILSTTKPMDVNLEHDCAVRTKQDHLSQLKVDVYKAAMNIQLCIKEVALQEQKLVLANEKLNMAEARYKASTITKEDVETVQYDVESCEVNLANTKEKLNTLYLDLKKLLDQQLNTNPVKINDEIKLMPFKEMGLDSVLTGLYSTETSVYKAESKYNIAKTAMGIAEKLYVKGSNTYDSTAMDLEEAKLDYTSAKTAIEVKVTNKYNELKNQIDNVQLSEKYEDLLSRKLSNAKVKYSKGTINKESFLSAQEALLDAEFAKYTAYVDFDNVRAEFLNILGMNY